MDEASVDNRSGILSPRSGGRNFLQSWTRENGIAIAVTFIVNLIVYNSLATDIIFSNHTIPNSYLYAFPSFKTTMEGRWFADILIQVFGGGGQALQAILGFAISALNGVLFADLVGIRGTPTRTLIALLINLHPAFLDLYSFTADNVSFTLAQTFAIAGWLCLDRFGTPRFSIPLSSLVFMLSMACYQPTLGVIASVGIAWIACGLILKPSSQIRKPALMGAASLVAGAALYWLSSKVAITMPLPKSTNLNSVLGVVGQVRASYHDGWHLFDAQARNLSWLGAFGLYLTVALGAAAGLYVAARTPAVRAAMLSVIFLLLPPALQLVYIVNDQSSSGNARFASGFAYIIAVFVVILIEVGATRRVGIALGLATTYGFAYIAVQENTYTVMKSLYEIHAINRVVQRIEEVVPDEHAHSMIVIGQLPLNDLDRIVEFPLRPLRPQTHTPAFMPYRQVEITNFFAGKALVAHPTESEVAAAVFDSESHPIWPQIGSIYMYQDTVVVVLSRDSTSTTWSR